MQKVIVVGSSNTDLVVRSGVLPGAGETVLGAKFAVFQGGKGANQAVATARAGAAVTFIASLGSDQFGDAAIRGYEREKINTGFISRSSELPTGVAVITVDESTGQNSILVASGANDALSESDVLSAADKFNQGDILLVQLEIPMPAVMAALRLARKNNCTTIVNPAPARELPADSWPLIDIITPNESETEILSGIRPDSPEKISAAAAFLLEKVSAAVIITLGENGSFVAEKNGRQFTVPAKTVRAVDTTAAGDVYNGYLAASLAGNKSLEEAVTIASIAAGHSVTQAGAQSSIPFPEQLKS